MLYLRKACQAIFIVCLTAIVTVVIMLQPPSPVTSYHMIEVEELDGIGHELADYKRDWHDCHMLTFNQKSEDRKSEAMTECLEGRGHH